MQVVYNIFDQNPEDELFPMCRERGVAVIARVPFDEGSLTGTMTRDMTWPDGDWRNLYFTPRQAGGDARRASTRVKHDLPAGMTLPELALRFILASPDVTTVIPGMRRHRTRRGESGASPTAVRWPPTVARRDSAAIDGYRTYVVA